MNEWTSLSAYGGGRRLSGAAKDEKDNFEPGRASKYDLV